MGKGSSPDYAAQERAAQAAADKTRAETEKAKSEADAKSLAERTAQATQDSQAAQKRRLLISQALDDKAAGFNSELPAERIEAQSQADTSDTEDPLGLNKKKKTLVGK